MRGRTDAVGPGCNFLASVNAPDCLEIGHHRWSEPHGGISFLIRFSGGAGYRYSGAKSFGRRESIRTVPKSRTTKVLANRHGCALDAVMPNGPGDVDGSADADAVDCGAQLLAGRIVVRLRQQGSA